MLFSGFAGLWRVTLVLAVVLTVIVLSVDRLMERPLTWIGRERVNYLRGAPGESFVRWLLQDLALFSAPHPHPDQGDCPRGPVPQARLDDELVVIVEHQFSQLPPTRRGGR